MSSICPFLSEHVYMNMRNGIQEGSPLHKESIHFMSIPEYKEELLNTRVQEMINRMQNAINQGRLIRDDKKISMKFPLKTVSLVDADQQALDDFKQLEEYILLELNC
mmetsp:Transcript_35474/g.25870  ORF Transcript_35474/g.25870 Transcript_35474/m.25870 type:complete len:107 (+) Transcript_35474:2483-2803(+)